MWTPFPDQCSTYEQPLPEKYHQNASAAYDNEGQIINELLRSVSGYYGWGIMEPRIVELVDVPVAALERYPGKYILGEQIPGIGDYLVDVFTEGEKLVVNDPNNGERDELSALDVHRFIDLEDGDEMKFQESGDSISFLWNNQYRFFKIQ